MTGRPVATISSNSVVLAGVVGADAVSLSTNGYAASFGSAGVSNGIAVSGERAEPDGQRGDQLYADAAGGADGEHHASATWGDGVVDQ